MTNAAIADLIASSLGALVNPHDGTPVVIPGFRTMGISDPDVIEQVAAISKLVGEAIVHLIETDGASQIVASSQLTKLAAAATAAEPQRHRQVQVFCHCGTKLFQLNVRDFDTDHPRVNGNQLIKALRGMNAECAVAHQEI